MDPKDGSMGCVCTNSIGFKVSMRIIGNSKTQKMVSYGELRCSVSEPKNAWSNTTTIFLLVLQFLFVILLRLYKSTCCFTCFTNGKLRLSQIVHKQSTRTVYCSIYLHNQQVKTAHSLLIRFIIQDLESRQQQRGEKAAFTQKKCLSEENGPY